MARESEANLVLDSMDMDARTKPKPFDQVWQFIQAQYHDLADELTSVLNRGGKGVHGPWEKI